MTNRSETDFRDLERLVALAKQVGRMGSWEVFYNDAGKPRIRWSPECQEIFGGDGSRLEGSIDDFLDTVHHFDVDHVRAAVKTQQTAGPMPELAFRIVLPDGSQRWVVLRGEVNPDGRAFGLVQDVTERRHAVEQSARDNKGLRALFESGRDGLVLWNDVARIVDANPAAVEIYGVPLDELVGIPIGTLSVSHDETLGGARGLGDRGVLERHKSGEVFITYRTVNRPDGTTRQIETVAIPNFLDEGLHLAILRDVTERERAAEALRAAEAQYRSLVEDMPLVTYILGPAKDSAPVYASPTAEQLLGYPVSRWTGSGSYDFHRQLVDAEDAERVRAELEAWSEEEPLDREYRVLAADGTSVWVLDKMVAVHDEHGALVCYQGFLLDISRRKELEDQLHQSQRMETIGRLAGGIAHDFNNLLTAITGYSSFALERLEAAGGVDERLQQDIEQIQRSAERATSLTQQLLAFGRRQVLQPRTLELNGLVSNVRTLLERLLGEDVEVVTTLTDELFVRADPGRLEQVLVNLAVNARDAMPGGGTFAIEVTETEVGRDHEIARLEAAPGRYPTLVVRDTGHGMDADTLAQVFEPFFTTKDVGVGTGLGLSMVYGIVKQSDGWITLESEPGEGTVATIYLPPGEPLQHAPGEPAAEPAAASGRILLVEDETVVRDLVAIMLAQRGYEVLEAAGPLEALELAETETCDLLLTDVVMPKMNGREVARRIRARVPELHVVYTSGYAPETVLDGGHLERGEFFLQKPFTAADLGEIVREALSPMLPS
ncbi:MAG: PAS domain-containing protein [Gaiellaceae bacterium]